MQGDNANKTEINVHNGAQVIVVNDDSMAYVSQNNNDSKNAKQKIKSRTKEYVDKWDANMFLNDFNEWDENAGVNVKLKDVYIKDHLPHFIWEVMKMNLLI